MVRFCMNWHGFCGWRLLCTHAQPSPLRIASFPLSIYIQRCCFCGWRLLCTRAQPSPLCTLKLKNYSYSHIEKYHNIPIIYSPRKQNAFIFYLFYKLMYTCIYKYTILYPDCVCFFSAACRWHQGKNSQWRKVAT